MPAPGTVRRLLPQPDPRLLWYEGFERTLDTRRWNRTDTEDLMAVGRGRAAKFNGTTQWLSRAGDDAAFSTGDVNFAIAGWFYLDSLPGGGGQQVLVEKWAGAAGAREWTLVTNNTGGTKTFQFAVRMLDDSATVVATAATFGTPVARTWYLIYAYHDKDADRVGISVNNGVADTTAIVGGVQDSPTALTVASRAGASAWLPGRVGPWGFWKTILPTAAVLTELYNSGNGRLYADLSADATVGLVEWYDMQELSGDRAGSWSLLTLTNNGSTLWGHGPTRSGTAGLVFSGGKATPSHGDPSLVRPWPIRRRAGLALEARVQSRAAGTSGPYLVASTVLAFNADTQREHGVFLSDNATIGITRAGTTLRTPYAYSANTDVYLLIVEDGTGAHYYASTDRINWTLLFVDPIGSTSELYAVLYSYNAAGQVQPARVYRRRVKPALVAIPGPVASGESYTAPATKASLRFKISTLGAATNAGMEFHYINADNRVVAYYNQAGGVVKVDQVVATVTSNLASQAVAYNAATELQAVWNGANLRVHYATTAIGAGLTINAALLAATTTRTWTDDAGNRLSDIYVEGGLP